VRAPATAVPAMSVRTMVLPGRLRWRCGLTLKERCKKGVSKR
jgi:hypothetical protein